MWHCIYHQEQALQALLLWHENIIHLVSCSSPFHKTWVSSQVSSSTLSSLYMHLYNSSQVSLDIKPFQVNIHSKLRVVPINPVPTDRRGKARLLRGHLKILFSKIKLPI